MCSTIPLTTIFTTTCVASSTALISKSIDRNTRRRAKLPRNLALQEIVPAANRSTLDNPKRNAAPNFRGCIFSYGLDKSMLMVYNYLYLTYQYAFLIIKHIRLVKSFEMIRSNKSTIRKKVKNNETNSDLFKEIQIHR